MATHKLAFRMFVRPGCEDEYRRRHDAIWPELVALLKQSGVSDYSIYLDAPRHVLFAVLRAQQPQALQDWPNQPVMQRWWQHMKDIMQCHPNGEPVSEPLPCLFHLN